MYTIPITRIKSTSSGQSCIVDDTIPMEKQLALGSQSSIHPYTSMRFHKTLVSERLESHCKQKPTPKARLEVHLTGHVKVTTSDGNFKVINPGDLISYEDIGGVGHIYERIGDSEHLALLFE